MANDVDGLDVITGAQNYLAGSTEESSSVDTPNSTNPPSSPSNSPALDGLMVDGVSLIEGASNYVNNRDTAVDPSNEEDQSYLGLAAKGAVDVGVVDPIKSTGYLRTLDPRARLFAVQMGLQDITEDDPEATPEIKTAREIDEATGEALGVDTSKIDSIPETLAYGAGSIAGFLAPSAIPGGVFKGVTNLGRPGRLISSTASKIEKGMDPVEAGIRSLQADAKLFDTAAKAINRTTGLGVAASGGASRQAEDAIASGATDEQVITALKLGAGVGATEVLPINVSLRVFDKFTKGASGAKQVIRSGVEGFLTEGGQELFAQVASNAIAADIVKYDPDRDIFEGAGEAAGIGGVLGAALNTIMAGMGAGRRMVIQGLDDRIQKAREARAQANAEESQSNEQLLLPPPPKQLTAPEGPPPPPGQLEGPDIAGALPAPEGFVGSTVDADEVITPEAEPGQTLTPGQANSQLTAQAARDFREQIHDAVLSNTKDKNKRHKPTSPLVYQYEDMPSSLQLKLRMAEQRRNVDPQDRYTAKELKDFGIDPKDLSAIRFSATHKPTRKFSNERQAIVDEATDIVNRLTGGKVNIRFDEQITDDTGGSVASGGKGKGERVAGFYDPLEKLIAISMDPDFDPIDTAFHEPWHFLREKGAFTQQELFALNRDSDRLLRSAALSFLEADPEFNQTQDKIQRKLIIEEAMTNLAKNMSQEEIEAVAIARELRKGREEKGFLPGTKRVFNRIAGIMSGIKNALEGNGFTSPEQVFRRVDQGRVADRPNQNVSDSRMKAIEGLTGTAYRPESASGSRYSARKALDLTPSRVMAGYADRHKGLKIEDIVSGSNAYQDLEKIAGPVTPEILKIAKDMPFSADAAQTIAAAEKLVNLAARRMQLPAEKIYDIVEFSQQFMNVSRYRVAQALANPEWDNTTVQIIHKLHTTMQDFDPKATYRYKNKKYSIRGPIAYSTLFDSRLAKQLEEEVLENRTMSLDQWIGYFKNKGIPAVEIKYGIELPLAESDRGPMSAVDLLTIVGNDPFKMYELVLDKNHMEYGPNYTGENLVVYKSPDVEFSEILVRSEIVDALSKKDRGVQAFGASHYQHVGEGSDVFHMRVSTTPHRLFAEEFQSDFEKDARDRALPGPVMIRGNLSHQNPLGEKFYRETPWSEFSTANHLSSARALMYNNMDAIYNRLGSDNENVEPDIAKKISEFSDTGLTEIFKQISAAPTTELRNQILDDVFANKEFAKYWKVFTDELKYQNRFITPDPNDNLDNIDFSDEKQIYEALLRFHKEAEYPVAALLRGDIDQIAFANGTLLDDKPKGLEFPIPNKWRQLGLKRLFIEAMNRGLTKLSWTTGRTQRSRYGLATGENTAHEQLYDKILLNDLKTVAKHFGFPLTANKENLLQPYLDVPIDQATFYQKQEALNRFLLEEVELNSDNEKEEREKLAAFLGLKSDRIAANWTYSIIQLPKHEKYAEMVLTHLTGSDAYRPGIGKMLYDPANDIKDMKRNLAKVISGPFDVGYFQTIRRGSLERFFVLAGSERSTIGEKYRTELLEILLNPELNPFDLESDTLHRGRLRQKIRAATLGTVNGLYDIEAGKTKLLDLLHRKDIYPDLGLEEKGYNEGQQFVSNYVRDVEGLRTSVPDVLQAQLRRYRENPGYNEFFDDLVKDHDRLAMWTVDIPQEMIDEYRTPFAEPSEFDYFIEADEYEARGFTPPVQPQPNKKVRMFSATPGVNVGDRIRNGDLSQPDQIISELNAEIASAPIDDSMDADPEEFSYRAMQEMHSSLKKYGATYKQYNRRRAPDPAMEKRAKRIFDIDDRNFFQRIIDWLAHARMNWKEEAIQSIFDGFHGIKAAEEYVNNGRVMDAKVSPWRAALFSQNLDSVLNVFMVSGPTIYDPNQGIFVRNDKIDYGFLEIFEPLAQNGLLEEWGWYAAAKRAQRLKAEGREALMSDQDINEFLGLAAKHKNTVDFDAIADRWYKFNSAVLDMAESAGVINKDNRAIWEGMDYVPFYRALDEITGVRGPRRKRGLVNQSAGIRGLKGGTNKLNDVYENMMMNMTKLVDASYKNIAARKVVDAFPTLVDELTGQGQISLEQVKIPAAAAKAALRKAGVTVGREKSLQEYLKVFALVPPKNPNTFHVLKDGKAVYYQTTDPLLLRSILMVNKQMPAFMNNIVGDAATGAKRLITDFITIDPGFVLANSLRDTISSRAVTGIHFSLLDTAKGFMKGYGNSDDMLNIMAAGGGGYGFFNSQPDYAKANIEELTRKGLGSSPDEWALNSFKDSWRFLQKAGRASEMMNRIAIYNSLKKQGSTEAEAVAQAQDLLNFSMRGENSLVMALAATIPFLNARLQGLYRLGRGFKENPVNAMIWTGMLAMFQIGLEYLHWDDDRYQALEGWDKDTYYHIYLDTLFGKDIAKQVFGDVVHVRLPKPFEVGLLGSTIPGRIFRAATGKDYVGDVGELLGSDRDTLMSSLGRGWLDTLALNPLEIQLFWPLVEQWANKSSFTGREIVSPGMETLPAYAQYDVNTSSAISAFSRIAGVDVALNSPQRLEYAVNSYLGTVGSYMVSIADIVHDALVGDKSPPAMRVRDIPVIGRFLREEPATTVKYMTEFYNLKHEADKIHRAAKKFRETRRIDDFKKLIEQPENRLLLAMRSQLNGMYTEMNRINTQRRLLYDQPMDSKQKRKLDNRLLDRRNKLAKQVERLLDRYERAK